MKSTILLFIGVTCIFTSCNNKPTKTKTVNQDTSSTVSPFHMEYWEYYSFHRNHYKDILLGVNNALKTY